MLNQVRPSETKWDQRSKWNRVKPNKWDLVFVHILQILAVLPIRFCSLSYRRGFLSEQVWTYDRSSIWNSVTWNAWEEAQPSQTILNPNETIWDHARSSDTNETNRKQEKPRAQDQVISGETKWDKEGPCETKREHVRLNDSKWDQMRPSVIKWYQVGPRVTEWD